MSNYIVIEISTDIPLTQLTDSANQATKKLESINALVDILSARSSGSKSGTVKVVTKNTTTTIATAGTGSASNTFTF